MAVKKVPEKQNLHKYWLVQVLLFYIYWSIDDFCCILITLMSIKLFESVHPGCSVSFFFLTAFTTIWASATIFTFIDLFRSSIFVLINVFITFTDKSFTVWTYQTTTFILPENCKSEQVGHFPYSLSYSHKCCIMVCLYIAVS